MLLYTHKTDCSVPAGQKRLCSVLSTVSASLCPQRQACQLCRSLLRKHDFSLLFLCVFEGKEQLERKKNLDILLKFLLEGNDLVKM